MKLKNNRTGSCPLPMNEYPEVMLAHGGGGTLSHRLVKELFLPAFNNRYLNQEHDGAVMDFGGIKLAFTTDSYVVQPLFFPGGDIGMLAVNGTVNDLAMCGALPLYLSAGFIIEEGFEMETLRTVVHSMKHAADTAGVRLVTGDTKVVDRGKGDGLFINTSGIGIVKSGKSINPRSVQEGDVILLNGDIGRHGIAILSAREGLSFECDIQSDTAPLAGVIINLLDAGIDIHCMRDCTRGGLASALNEIAATARIKITIDEGAVPVHDQVRGACEILGFDPLYIANEGRFIMFVPQDDADRARDIIAAQNGANNLQVIGRVTTNGSPLVTVNTVIGTSRVLHMLSGEQLPRIC